MELNQLLSDNQHSNEVEGLIESQLRNKAFNFGPDTGKLVQGVLEKINLTEQKDELRSLPRVPSRRHIITRLSVAAIFLLAVATTFIVYKQRQSVKQNTIAKQDVMAPNSSKAILTLANGTKVVLDTVITGVNIAGAIKTPDGLIYNGQADKTEYQTLTNPKGSKPVSLVLSDGSMVWLNTASSITFPTLFSGNKRTVSITGEAFFEVVHDAAKPFQVKAADQLVEDIGTSFNINAYEDEGMIRTTLVTGAAFVGNNQQKLIVNAGEKTELVSGKIKKGKADIEQALAWKNNLFSFSHAGIPEIMRQICRWYDVRVVYQNGIPDETFTGDIGRGLTLEQALKVLEKMSAHFTIEEGNKIVIKP